MSKVFSSCDEFLLKILCDSVNARRIMAAAPHLSWLLQKKKPGKRRDKSTSFAGFYLR